MAIRPELFAFLQMLPHDIWGSPALCHLEWILHYHRLAVNQPFLRWLADRFYPHSMAFRVGDVEISPLYEEFCAIMGHTPNHRETPALPPLPTESVASIIERCPFITNPVDLDMPDMPLRPFLNRVLEMNISTEWLFALTFLILNVFTCQNSNPNIGDIRLLSVAYDMAYHGCTPHMLIMGETMGWVYDISVGERPFSIHRRGCPILLQIWAYEKLCVLPPVLDEHCAQYGPRHLRSRFSRQLVDTDNILIRWTCPWWRITAVTVSSLNRGYVLYCSLDHAMAYFPARLCRQYGDVQRRPHRSEFNMGPATPPLIRRLTEEWSNRLIRAVNPALHEESTEEYEEWFLQQIF